MVRIRISSTLAFYGKIDKDLHLQCLVVGCLSRLAAVHSAPSIPSNLMLADISIFYFYPSGTPGYDAMFEALTGWGLAMEIKTILKSCCCVVLKVSRCSISLAAVFGQHFLVRILSFLFCPLHRLAVGLRPMIRLQGWYGGGRIAGCCSFDSN